MKRKKESKEVLINIPTRLRYYLDSLAILIVAIAIAVIIILTGRSIF